MSGKPRRHVELARNLRSRDSMILYLEYVQGL